MLLVQSLNQELHNSELHAVALDDDFIIPAPPPLRNN